MFFISRRDARWTGTPFILATLSFLMTVHFITVLTSLSLAVRSDPYPHLTVPSFFTLSLSAVTFGSAFLHLCGLYTGYLKPQVVAGLSVAWMVGWAADVVLMVAYMETGELGGVCRRRKSWERVNGMEGICQSATATTVFAMVNL